MSFAHKRHLLDTGTTQRALKPLLKCYNLNVAVLVFTWLTSAVKIHLKDRH